MVEVIIWPPRRFKVGSTSGKYEALKGGSARHHGNGRAGQHTVGAERRMQSKKRMASCAGAPSSSG